MATIWHKHALLKVNLFVCAYSATVFQQRTILSCGVSFMRNQRPVLADVGFRKQQITSSLLVVTLVNYGCIFGADMVSLWLILIVFRTIFISFVG